MGGRDTTTEGAGIVLGPPPPDVPRPLWERLARAAKSVPCPLAVFDADGTLWADDLGETHLVVIDEWGNVSPGDGYVSVLDEYHQRCERDVDDGYAWGTSVLAAAGEEETIAAAVEAWRRHRGQLLEPVANVVRGLLEAGVEVAVVSASNRWVIEVAVAELGIEPGGIVAVDLVRADGRLTPEVVQPMPNGEGKVAAIDALLGRRPVIAFGNSVHDAPMLRCATEGVLVLATTPGQRQLSPALDAMCGEEGWAQLLVPHPLVG